MIHRDLCDPIKTKNYSSLRIQFHLLLSRYVCWDGFIPLTRRELADLLSCDIQSIHKFIKKGILEGILSLEGDRLYLLKKVTRYTDGYVKHYPFLESPQFRNLSIHAQRFVLYTLWAGVHTGRPLKRDLTTLYHSAANTHGVLNLYSRAPIYAILEESKTFLTLEIVDSKGKEMVRVTGLREQYANEQALENQGEMKLLKDILEFHNCDELVSSSSCEEILKLKKHYMSTLNSIGVELFSNALKKILSVQKLYELDRRGEVGIYLKSILKDLEEKILPTLQKRINHTQNAIKKIKKQVDSGAQLWTQKFMIRMDELSQALQFLLTKKKKDPSSNIDTGPFPFYNWLEME